MAPPPSDIFILGGTGLTARTTDASCGTPGGTDSYRFGGTGLTARTSDASSSFESREPQISVLGVGATQHVACFTPLIVGLGPSYYGPSACSGMAATTPDGLRSASHAIVPDPYERDFARLSNREQYYLPSSPTAVSRSRSPTRATQHAVHYRTNDDHLHPFEGTLTAASEHFCNHAENSSTEILPFFGEPSSNTRGSVGQSVFINTIDCFTDASLSSGWLPGAAA